MSWIIKVSNFTLYSSIGFLLPYLESQFNGFAGPSSGDSGWSEWIRRAASLAAIPIGLALCLSADRSATHWRVYLLCRTCFLLCAIFLLSMTILHHQSGRATDATRANGTLDPTAAATATGRPAELPPLVLLVSLASASLVVALAVGTQMLEFLTIDSVRRQEAKNYGSLRLFGPLGGLASTLMLAFLTEYCQVNANAKATVSLVLAILVGSPDLILACCWLHAKPHPGSQDDCISLDEPDDQAISGGGTKFEFSQNLWASRKFELECKQESRLASVLWDSVQPVTIVKASLKRQFDTREEDEYRNIRRCSLAPLGDSFLVKQFELDRKNVRHFNFVTNVQPLESASARDKTLIPTIEYSLNSNSTISLDRKMNHLSLGEFASPEESTQATTTTTTSGLTIDIQLGLMRDLASRSDSFVRFSCSLAFAGFVLGCCCCGYRAQGNQINQSVSSILGHICEVSFYLSASRLTRLVSYESNLILIVLAHALIHGSRVAFTQSPGIEATHHIDIPRATTTMVESVCGAWLNCVLVEAAMEFADECRFSVPELIKARKINLDGESRARVANGLRATVVCLLFSSLNGIGNTFGSSLASLHLFETHGSIELDTAICLLNVGFALAFIVILKLVMHC